jgi:alpha-1,2-mannosyltransferase
VSARVERVVGACRTPLRQWLIVFGLLGIVYLLTASYGDDVVTDNFASSLPAHWFVTHGTFRLDDYVGPQIGFHASNPWFVHTPDGHIVSNRQPGIVLTTVPFAVVIRTGSTVLGAVTAAIVSAAGVATLSLALRRLLGVRMALAATAVAGLATSIWSVAAEQLWPHSVDTLWLSLVLVSLAAQKPVRAGWAFAASILVRAHLSVAAAATGLWQGLQQRSWRPVLAVGLPAAAGLAALLLWNHYFFGQWNLRGGYPDGYSVSNKFSSMPGWQYPVRYVGMLFSPSRGILVTSPFFLVLLPGLRAAWRAAPPWVRAVTLGGVAYLLVQQHVNTFAGAGTGFYAYRNPIESLLLLAPMFALAYTTWVRTRAWRIRAFRALLAASLCLQGVGAILYEGYSGSAAQYSPWRNWPFGDILADLGWVAGSALAVLMVLLVVLAAMVPVRTGDEAVIGDGAKSPAAASARV